VPSSSEPIGRFVLDQDIGGAITGGGRLDLFWGRGVEAKRYAGAMKTTGRLYYLGPKAVRD
jgi:membrane-bound lytic murein transglycosylase A